MPNALPKGCEIVHFPGREQPYTIYMTGDGNYYYPFGPRFVWQFCYTLDEAERFLERVTGWHRSDNGTPGATGPVTELAVSS